MAAQRPQSTPLPSDDDPISATSGGKQALDYLARNRSAWERWAPHYRAAGRRAWVEDEPRWGMWGLLESDLRLLERCEPGMNVVDLGCGTGYVCARLARAGMHPVGIDIAQAQIDSA